MTLKVSPEMISVGVEKLGELLPVINAWPRGLGTARAIEIIFETMQQVGNKAYQRDYQRRKRLRVGEAK